MVHIEDTVKQAFSDSFKKYAQENNVNFKALDLNGNDRNLLADNFFSAKKHCFLVEFKNSNREISNEHLKSKSQDLCNKLPVEQELSEMHDRCHFISYRNLSCESQGRIDISIYREAVCNNNLNSKSMKEFFNEFFHKKIIGLCGSEFLSYLKQLLQLWEKDEDKKDLSQIEIGVTYEDEEGNIIASVESLANIVNSLIFDEPEPDEPKRKSHGLGRRT